MECRPFRFKQRRTRISGRKPDISSLYDGELYLNTCDGKAFFRNSACDGLFTIITDASSNGLNNIKFSGANTGDVPIWNGSGFSACQVDVSGSVKTTGDQLISGIKSFDSCIVLTGDYPRIVDFGGCFTIENGMGASLNAPYGFRINAIDTADSCNSPLYKNFSFYSESYSSPTFRLPEDSRARAYITITQIPSVGSYFELTDENGDAHSFIIGPIGDKDYSVTIDQDGTLQQAADSIVQKLIDSNKFYNVHYSATDEKIWVYQRSVGIQGNRSVVNQGMEGVGAFDGGTSRLIFGDGSVQTTAFSDANFVKISGNQTVSGIKNFHERPTVNGTGVLLSGEVSSNSSNLDNGYFQQVGDSEYLTSFARAITQNDNWTNLLKNSSQKLYELKNDEEIYFIIDVTSAGSSKTASFKIEGSAKRGSITQENGVQYSSSILLNSVKTTFQKSNINYDVRVYVDNSDGSIKLQSKGDIDYLMRWYAKIQILRLDIVSSINLYSNLYFSGSSNVNWNNTGNWYTNPYFSHNALTIPQTGTIAYMYGTSGSFVDLDNENWKTPLLINTLNVSDNNGICFYSNNNAKFTGSLIGNSSFWGNSSQG